MTNLILTVCAVVSNAVVSTMQMQLVPVYEKVKAHDDPNCYPCHSPYLAINADCSCKWKEIITHYVIVPKKDGDE